MRALARFSSLDREILALALPAVGSGLAPVLHLWIDTLWAGQLPQAEAPLAALSVATFTRWIFSSIAGLAVTGVTALTARAVGAGRLSEASWLGFQGLTASCAIAVLIAIAGWFGAPVVYTLVTDDPAVIAAGSTYVRIFWVGGLAMLLQRTGDAIFRAHGNTTAPFLLSGLSVAANAILDPILMFGLGPIPAFGIAGAAYASVAGAGITAAVSISTLSRLGWIARTAPEFEGEGAEGEEKEDGEETSSAILGAARSRDSRGQRSFVDLRTFFRIGRIGLPVAWAGLTFSAIYLALSRIVEDTGGRAALAALGLGHRGESVAFVVCTGFADATASIVGRRLGAGRADEAELAAWRAALHASILCGLWSVVLVFAGPTLAGFVVEPGEVHTLTTAYFRIAAVCLIPQAVELVLEGAFSGAGKTLPPMVITITLSVLRIPLALLVAERLGLGITAIWWVLSATAIARGVAMAFWFRFGTWKTARI